MEKFLEEFFSRTGAFSDISDPFTAEQGADEAFLEKLSQLKRLAQQAIIDNMLAEALKPAEMSEDQLDDTLTLLGSIAFYDRSIAPSPEKLDTLISHIENPETLERWAKRTDENEVPQTQSWNHCLILLTVASMWRPRSPEIVFAKRFLVQNSKSPTLVESIKRNESFSGDFF